MKRKYKQKPKKQREIARERIKVLFKEAKKVFNKNPKLADRYVALARKIAMRYKVRIPPELKRKFCKYCHTYLVPGVNCRVRVQHGKVIYYCMKCKRFIRYPYIREKKAKRKSKQR